MRRSTNLEFGHHQKSLRRRERSTWPRSNIAALVSILGLATACGGTPPASPAADDSLSKTAGGMAVYIGLMPAAIVKGHPAVHPETTMHGGPPAGQHEYHLVVAVFDGGTGQRISDATVKVRVSNRDSAGSDVALEPMNIADTITYGGFFSLPNATGYKIRVDVKRPQATSVAFDFSYDHQPP